MERMLYYIRQKAGNVRVMDVDTMAAAIESKSSLTAGWLMAGCSAEDELENGSATQQLSMTPMVNDPLLQKTGHAVAHTVDDVCATALAAQNESMKTY